MPDEWTANASIHPTLSKKVHMHERILMVDDAFPLHQLLKKHGPLEPELPGWSPVEAPLPDLPEPHPSLIPDLETARAALAAPEIPLEFPAIDRLLAEIAATDIDPWE